MLLPSLPDAALLHHGMHVARMHKEHVVAKATVLLQAYQLSNRLCRSTSADTGSTSVESYECDGTRVWVPQWSGSSATYQDTDSS